MASEEIARVFKALYPDELIRQYQAGERNFKGINLLRAEIEHIFRVGRMEVQTSQWSLWEDFRTVSAGDKWFEWDAHGRFMPVERDDVPPRNLSGADLSDADFESAYLYPVDLSGANLSGANLRGAKLIDANLTGANLTKADLRHACLDKANLHNANLYMARMERASLNGADLRGANLRRAKLEKTILFGADLSGADMRKAHFRRTELQNVNLRDTNLQDVQLDNVFVRGAVINASQQMELIAALGVRVLSENRA